MTDNRRKLRLGVAGLGRAFMLMLPTLAGDRRLELVAAADPRPEARSRFEADFAGARTYDSVASLCADPQVEAVYVATPHQFHLRHVADAAGNGKHVLVEKPMALTLEECRGMIAAARQAGVHLIVGHSHSFDAPYLRAREIIASGAHGRARMITAVNFTDFLYRPRRAEELDTTQGGGVVFSQAAHQVDVVRLLGGGHVRSVRAATGGAWDPARPTEGAYAAFLTFEDETFATLTYSGHAHFDTDEFLGWVGELGQKRDPDRYGTAREALRRVNTPGEEAALKTARTYGVPGAPSGLPSTASPSFHNHFGLVIVSCDRADLRPTATGVMIYADAGCWLEPVPTAAVPRAEVVDELYDVVVLGRSPVHSGEWGLATTEVCLAILRSAREGREIAVNHQAGVPRPRSTPLADAPLTGFRPE